MYFRFRSGARGGSSARTRTPVLEQALDPYVWMKCMDQEIKTPAVIRSWPRRERAAFSVMREYDPANRDVELYVFDYENFSSDDLGDPLHDPWLTHDIRRNCRRFSAGLLLVAFRKPCSTTEQDKLKSAFSGRARRSRTKAIAFFRDLRVVHTSTPRFLGAMCVSSSSPFHKGKGSLVRQSKQTRRRRRGLRRQRRVPLPAGEGRAAGA